MSLNAATICLIRIIWNSNESVCECACVWNANCYCCWHFNLNQKTKSAQAANAKSANNWQSLGINVALSPVDWEGKVGGEDGWDMLLLLCGRVCSDCVCVWCGVVWCVWCAAHAGANFKICWPQMAKVWQVNGICQNVWGIEAGEGRLGRGSGVEKGRS